MNKEVWEATSVPSRNVLLSTSSAGYGASSPEPTPIPTLTGNSERLMSWTGL